MKKIVIAFLLLFVGTSSYGQTWDKIKYDIRDCREIKWEKDVYQFQDLSYPANRFIPACVYDRYQFGRTLMKAGWVNFGVGLGISAIGSILLVTNINHNDLQNKAGYAFNSIGGTLVVVSIPLLCFGDNAKREANVDYEVFNLQYRNNLSN